MTSCGCLNLEIHCNIAGSLRESFFGEKGKNYQASKTKLERSFDTKLLSIFFSLLLSSIRRRPFSHSPEEAPRTSDNFLRLCEKNYYDNTVGGVLIGPGFQWKVTCVVAFWVLFIGVLRPLVVPRNNFCCIL